MKDISKKNKKNKKKGIHSTKNVQHLFPLERIRQSRELLELYDVMYDAGLDNWGGDAAPLITASDRHATDAASIPRCGKGFFSQSQLSEQTLLRCPYIPCAIACMTSVGTLKIL